MILSHVSYTWAQETIETEIVENTDKNEKIDTPKTTLETASLVPAIIAEEFVKEGTISSFDASETRLVSRTAFGMPNYWWDFGDGTSIKYGKKVAHQYEAPGKYTTKLTVKQGKIKETITKEVFIYEKQGILISDQMEEIPQVINQAAEQGIWLKEISYDRDKSGLSIEEEFTQKIQENLPFIRESKLIIFHTSSVTGLQSFAQVWQKLSAENKFDLSPILWVQLVEGSIDQVAKLTQPLFQILRPRFIILTRLEALNPIFRKSNPAQIDNTLSSRAIEYLKIDERSRTNPIFIFSKLVTYFVSQGITQNVVYLLLVVPFLTFLTAFIRQVVGISTYGVYAPLVLSLSFLALGFEFGLSVFLVTLFVSYLIRVLFEKVELLYIPRLSLLLSALALSFFLVLGFAAYLKVNLNLSLAIFPMLVMSTVSEKFLSAQSEEGMKNAIIVAVETVFVSLLGYFIFNYSSVKDAILATPELLLLPILGNVWLGKFTGLRLTEYFKFRSLLREDSQEE